MVKEKELFDTDKFNILKEDINVYEELMKDVVNVFSAVMNLGIHSGMSINRLIKHIGNDCIEKEGEKNEFEKNMGMNNNNDNDMDLIRFTNNGPIFQISKSVLDSLKGSFIEEQRDEEKRTNDGSIYLDYPGKDVFIYYLLDYVNGEKVNFDSFSYEEQLGLLDLFEFCGLVIPLELIDCRERRDTKKKKYELDDKVDLIITGKKNDIIKKYLINNNLWIDCILEYDNGFIDYNHIDDSLYMNKEYEYIEYIMELAKNGFYIINNDNNVDKEVLENEISELLNINEIDLDLLEIPLVSWLGKEKRWKLLFRASEHNYSGEEFNRLCYHHGETVTIIKHIGHDNHINIFGGYTDQNWSQPVYNKNYENEFIFTICNEHNIPPTKYDYFGGPCCGRWCHLHNNGPYFGGYQDIRISDFCHTNHCSCCSTNNFETKKTSKKSSLFVNTNDADSTNYFTVEDYEVWERA
ncbi:hypothetical protein WA158_000401 [Blastocystis sp. Blastoise]